jgi:hypothetical protein
MPTNRKRKSRIGQHTQLEQDIIGLLLYGTKPQKDSPAWPLYVDRHFDDKKKIKATWREHGPDLMKLWKRPRRPWAEEVLSDAV